MNIREFQSDLQNGMTLENALNKHGVTLEQAFNMLQYFNANQHKGGYAPIGGNTGEAYIRYDDNSQTFMLRKKVNGKFTYFGRYETLKDAVLVRDYMMTHGWYKHRLKSIREELGV